MIEWKTIWTMSAMTTGVDALLSAPRKPTDDSDALLPTTKTSTLIPVTTMAHRAAGASSPGSPLASGGLMLSIGSFPEI